MGQKNGEGAKRRAKVHTFREKSENSQIGTVGPCFSLKRDFLVIFSQKMKISLGKVGVLKGFLRGCRKSYTGATKMARVPKDAQRSKFFEGKNKNANLALLVLMGPANVIPIFSKSTKSKVFPNFDLCTSAVCRRKTVPGCQKIDNIIFFLKFQIISFKNPCRVSL